MELIITPPALTLPSVGWERPLPAAWWVAQDSAVLAFALTLLRTTLAEAMSPTSGQVEQRVVWVAQAGRQHRLIINQGRLLRTLPQLAFVGFFGQRRRGLMTAPLLDLVVALDDALVEELRAHPGIVGYCTCELADGDYGNLVLLRDEAAKVAWTRSEQHSYVAQTLAPHYYRSVRLHHGSIPGGLAAGHDPVIERTQYFDYVYDYEKKQQGNEQVDSFVDSLSTRPCYATSSRFIDSGVENQQSRIGGRFYQSPKGGATTLGQNHPFPLLWMDQNGRKSG